MKNYLHFYNYENGPRQFDIYRRWESVPRRGDYIYLVENGKKTAGIVTMVEWSDCSEPREYPYVFVALRKVIVSKIKAK